MKILKPVGPQFRGGDKSQIQIIGGLNTLCYGYSPNGDIIDCECTMLVLMFVGFTSPMRQWLAYLCSTDTSRQ